MDIWKARESSNGYLESVVGDAERQIAKLRASQAVAINELAVRQIDTATGCRSMAEWLAGRADLAPEHAASIVKTAWALNAHPRARTALEDGEISYDRATELVRGEYHEDEDLDFDTDIAGLRRRNAKTRRMTRHDEHRLFVERYLTFQPTLDGASGRLHGQLPGLAFRTVEKAIHERGDELGDLPDGSYRRGQRNADALVAIAQDSLHRDGDPETAPGGTIAVLVDAREAAASNAETGVTVEAGPRVGPETLDAVRCNGVVEVTALTTDGVPLGIGRRSRTIPGRLRRFVLHRDGGCVADGCTSRYRLEVHHKHEWSHGGRTDPENCITLCWFHHHIVIHGHGFMIDPESPPGRIRFLRRPWQWPP